MKNSRKALIMLFACMAGFFAVLIYSGALEWKKPAEQASKEPRVIKIKEVIGQVVGGPQIVSGNPLIGYAVYIEESKTWGALLADGCPTQLGTGSRVIMYQREGVISGLGSAWYTFIRLE